MWEKIKLIFQILMFLFVLPVVIVLAGCTLYVIYDAVTR